MNELKTLPEIYTEAKQLCFSTLGPTDVKLIGNKISPTKLLSSLREAML